MTGRPLDGRARRYIQPTLMAHFEKHPGKTIDVDELCRVTGASKLQVQKSMGGVRSKPIWRDHLEVVVVGNAWRYRERPGQVSGFSEPPPMSRAAGTAEVPLTVMGREGFGAARAKAAREASQPEPPSWRVLGMTRDGDTILERSAGGSTGLYRATPL